jgi:hypothetical protein
MSLKKIKTNRIELSKTKGMTIEVLNGPHHQRIFLDGEKITITVIGPEGAGSVIEQTAGSVKITADRFEVNARETITMSSMLSTKLQTEKSILQLTPASSELTAPITTIDAVGVVTVKGQGPALLLSQTVATVSGNAGVVINSGIGIALNNVPFPAPPSAPIPVPPSPLMPTPPDIAPAKMT